MAAVWINSPDTFGTNGFDRNELDIRGTADLQGSFDHLGYDVRRQPLLGLLAPRYAPLRRFDPLQT